MIAEHRKPLLESRVCSELPEKVATQSARGTVPVEILKFGA